MKIKLKPGALLASVWKNFPLSIVFCLLLTAAYTASDIHSYTHIDQSTLFEHLLPALWLGLTATTATYCLKRRYPLPAFLPLAVATAGTVAGYVFFDRYYLITGLVLCALMLCLHGTAKDHPDIRLGQIGGWFFVSLGVSLVLYIALNACQSVLFSLFFQNIFYRTEYIFQAALVYICFFTFAPAIFLGGLPDESTPIDKRNGLKKFSAVVLLPLYLLLLGVLLLYVLKILVTLSMPVGVMNSYAIAALSLFVYFHLLLTGDENKLSLWFRRFGGLLLLPIIAAQGIGIFIRVQAYGLTVSRILGIAWSLLCIGVVITSLFKRANWFFPAAAAVAVLIFSSPFNAENLARLHQESLLRPALERNGMLAADGKITPNAAASDKAIIYSAVDYLEDISAPESTLTHTLQAQLAVINEEHNYSFYSNAAKNDLLGFKKPQNDSDWHSFTYRLTGSADETRLDVQGFDYAELITVYNDDKQPEHAAIACDTAALVEALRHANRTGEALNFSLPIVLSVYDEEIDVSPLLQGIELLDGDAQLAQDALILPSGKTLRIVSLHVYDYVSSTYQENSLTLSAWLLTPEK